VFPLAGQSYKFGEKIGSHVFEDDPGLSPQSSSCHDTSKKDEQKTAYCCKKCRRIIAVKDNVISHVPGEGESCFNWNQRKSERPYDKKEQDCSSLFIEPLKWMTPGMAEVIFLLEYHRLVLLYITSCGL
jgi:dual specificity phosphatase 12